MADPGPDPGTKKILKPEKYGWILTEPNSYMRNTERIPPKGKDPEVDVDG